MTFLCRHFTFATRWQYLSFVRRTIVNFHGKFGCRVSSSAVEARVNHPHAHPQRSKYTSLRSLKIAIWAEKYIFLLSVWTRVLFHSTHWTYSFYNLDHMVIKSKTPLEGSKGKANWDTVGQHDLDVKYWVIAARTKTHPVVTSKWLNSTQ